MKLPKGRLMTTHDGIEMVCFYPNQLKEYTQYHTQLHLLKTLTDEEIRKVADEVFKDYKNWHHYQIDFARAILRKAQEK